jgi:hypothetical protein
MGNIILLHVHMNQIYDDITSKSRQPKINTPDIVPPNKRKPYKKVNGATSGKKALGSKDASGMEDMMAQLMNRVKRHISNTLTEDIVQEMSQQCAEVTRHIFYVLQFAHIIFSCT